MRYIIKCSRCNWALTKLLERLTHNTIFNEMEDDSVPVGFYAPERGDFVVNLNDVLNTKHHTDSRRLNGCCGMDGLDGLNTMCANGHEVGTEQSDCWTPRKMTFDGKRTQLDKV